MSVDSRADVIVLGSGAAGLTAAGLAAREGLSVLLLERADFLGGTTAWSGGVIWAPCARPALDAGINDSREKVLTYLDSLSRGWMDRGLVDTFVDGAPRMIDALTEAGIEFELIPELPDYHAEQPGGMPAGGRSLATGMFAFVELGEWADKVPASPYYPTPHLDWSETSLGSGVAPADDDPVYAARLERDIRGSGQALAGKLLKLALDAGVEIRTESRAVELVRTGDRVTGVVVETPDGRYEARADRGVVIATGGFEWDERAVRTYLSGPAGWPISVRTNTGDGLRMAQQVNARLYAMQHAWWTTVAELPEGVNPMNRIMLTAERSRPRCIMVNKHGKRFSNESANYSVQGLMHHNEAPSGVEYANSPSWLIFDHEFIRRYGVVGLPPVEEAPEWLTGYATLEELGEAVGIDPANLVATVAEWNASVADGHDPLFNRGIAAHDRFNGDRAQRGTWKATLGPIDQGPYYALPVQVGLMGTKGGPHVDKHARVTDIDGNPIPGLYAAGNAAASPLGITYGGAGGTLGPAMTFGFLAAKHLASTPQ